MSKPVWQEATCKDCIFWIRKEAAAGVGGPVMGECRRRPPSATGVPLIQQRGGIEIAGQKHTNLEVQQIAVLGNYPPIGAENPACGDFILAAPFDEVVKRSSAQAQAALPQQPPRKISDR